MDQNVNVEVLVSNLYWLIHSECGGRVTLSDIPALYAKRCRMSLPYKELYGRLIDFLEEFCEYFTVRGSVVEITDRIPPRNTEKGQAVSEMQLVEARRWVVKEQNFSANALLDALPQLTCSACNKVAFDFYQLSCGHCLCWRCVCSKQADICLTSGCPDPGVLDLSLGLDSALIVDQHIILGKEMVELLLELPVNCSFGCGKFTRQPLHAFLHHFWDCERNPIFKRNLPPEHCVVVPLQADPDIEGMEEFFRKQVQPKYALVRKHLQRVLPIAPKSAAAVEEQRLTPTKSRVHASSAYFSADSEKPDTTTTGESTEADVCDSVATVYLPNRLEWYDWRSVLKKPVLMHQARDPEQWSLGVDVGDRVQCLKNRHNRAQGWCWCRSLKNDRVGWIPSVCLRSPREPFYRFQTRFEKGLES